MILLSALIHFRLSILLFIGISMVVFHNAFDGISFRNGTSADVIWSLLHVSKTFNLGDDYIFSVVYPIIPWIGVMALGYCVGCLYNVNYPTEKRKRILRSLGSVSILIFIVLRFVNIYGDPVTWTAQTSLVKTFMSFFNLTKYPPSLFYLTATLGISLHLLAWIDAKNFDKWKAISLFGKVSLFYYVLHLYVIHLLAVLAAVLSGLPWQSMVFLGSISKGSPMLIGNYGFWLGTIYFIWICIVIGLYPICDWWYTLKIRNKQKWWVSYV